MRFTIIIGFSLLSACSLSQYNDAVEAFNEAKGLIPYSLSDHFPRIESRPNTSLVVQKPVRSNYNEGLELEYFVKDKTLLDSLQSVIETYCIDLVEINDPCKLILDRPYAGSFDQDGKECKDNSTPIPIVKRWIPLFEDLSNKLPDDLLLCIIEGSPGKFLPDSLLTNGGGMPKSWKNGFSRGISLSNEAGIVVYWLIVW